jgi:hypothetical protein
MHSQHLETLRHVFGELDKTRNSEAERQSCYAKWHLALVETSSFTLKAGVLAANVEFESRMDCVGTAPVKNSAVTHSRKMLRQLPAETVLFCMESFSAELLCRRGRTDPNFREVRL